MEPKLYNANKNILLRTKGRYFLKKLFLQLTTLKKLLLIRRNKGIQNRLEIYKKDYDEYCAIEIEIIPYASIIEKKEKFINLLSSPDRVNTIYIL